MEESAIEDTTQPDRKSRKENETVTQTDRAKPEDKAPKEDFVFKKFMKKSAVITGISTIFCFSVCAIPAILMIVTSAILHLLNVKPQDEKFIRITYKVSVVGAVLGVLQFVILLFCWDLIEEAYYRRYNGTIKETFDVDSNASRNSSE